MSRYNISDPDDEVQIIVGWDPPLNEFFAQVWKKDDEEEPHKNLTAKSVLVLGALVAPFSLIAGGIRDEIRAKLRADSLQPRQPVSPSIQKVLDEVRAVVLEKG